MGPTRRNDTATFLDITAQLLSGGYRVRFRAHGASMRPAIRDGDIVVVQMVDPTAVKPGDILLYREGERPLAHRVVRIHQDNSAGVVFVLRGDAQAECDAPVKPEQVLGRVLLAERNGRRGILSYLWSWCGLGRRHHFLAPRAIRQT
jgi:signal peptidase I